MRNRSFVLGIFALVALGQSVAAADAGPKKIKVGLAQPRRVDAASGLDVGDVAGLYAELDALAGDPRPVTIELAANAIYRLDSSLGDEGRIVLPLGASIAGGNVYLDARDELGGRGPDGIPDAVGVDADGDRVFALRETLLDGSGLTGGRAVIEAGLDNGVASLTVRGNPDQQAEISFQNVKADNTGTLTVTGVIAEGSDRGIVVSGFFDDSTLTLVASGNVFRHHVHPGVIFAWGIQIVPGFVSGIDYTAFLTDNRFYDNRIGLFLPSLGVQDGAITAFSTHNVYEDQNDAEFLFGAGIYIFTRDFGNPAGSHRNHTRLVSVDDMIWNNACGGGVFVEGIRRDSNGVELADNTTDVLLSGTGLVKLAGGAFDGPQNHDEGANLRRDVTIIGRTPEVAVDHPVDLAGTSLTFTPGAGGYTVAAGTDGFDVDGFGPALDYSGPPNADFPIDDDTAFIGLLTFDFPFEGHTSRTLYANSDGNLTIDVYDFSSDARDVNRLLSGAPRIAPLLTDLALDQGGSVHANLHDDRAVITWVDVPSWEMNLEDSNTFQVVLFADGTIRFVYGDIGLRTAVVGIAPGGDGGPAIETDLSAAAGDVSAPAIYENFVGALIGPASGNRVNVVLDGARSSLAPTSYDPAPQPFVVHDDAPAEVTITVTGSLIY